MPVKSPKHSKSRRDDRKTPHRNTTPGIYGNDIQPSLRDSCRCRRIPGVETPGYCRVVPLGRMPADGSRSPQFAIRNSKWSGLLFRFSFWDGRLGHLAFELSLHVENTMSDESDKQPRFVTCRCQHCDAHIEFDASGLEEGDTATVNCPHCQVDTTLLIPQTSLVSAVAIPPILEPTLPQPVWFGSETSLLQIKTTSGAEFEIISVRLFNAADLQMLAIKKAIAAQKMGGVFTGLGSIGSFSSVILQGRNRCGGIYFVQPLCNTRRKNISRSLKARKTASQAWWILSRWCD